METVVLSNIFGYNPFHRWRLLSLSSVGTAAVLILQLHASRSLGHCNRDRHGFWASRYGYVTSSRITVPASHHCNAVLMRQGGIVESVRW